MSYLPELRASLVKAAHRQRTMAAMSQQHRARPGGRWRSARSWLSSSVGGVSLLFATASTVAVVVVALTTIGHRHPTPAPVTGSSTEAFQTAARAAAVRSLDQLALPLGAVQSGLPAGIPTELRAPASQLSTRHRVDVHRVWRLPGNPQSVISFIKAHPPAGSQLGAESEAGSGPKGGPCL